MANNYNAENLNSFPFLNQRVCGRIHALYGVNSHEMNFLLTFAGYVVTCSKSIVAKYQFYKQVSGNTKRYAKYEGYLRGLLDKGMIGSYEYIYYPDSQMIGLSDLGAKCIESYHEEVNKLRLRYKPRASVRDRVANTNDKYKMRAFERV